MFKFSFTVFFYWTKFIWHCFVLTANVQQLRGILSYLPVSSNCWSVCAMSNPYIYKPNNLLIYNNKFQKLNVYKCELCLHYALDKKFLKVECLQMWIMFELYIRSEIVWLFLW